MADSSHRCRKTETDCGPRESRMFRFWGGGLRMKSIGRVSGKWCSITFATIASEAENHEADNTAV